MIKIATTATTARRTAKQEITDFLTSSEVGIKSEFKANTLQRAAEQMFTANGQISPVHIVVNKGETFLIKREHVNGPIRV